jgi:hypothetical protein
MRDLVSPSARSAAPKIFSYPQAGAADYPICRQCCSVALCETAHFPRRFAEGTGVCCKNAHSATRRDVTVSLFIVRNARRATNRGVGELLLRTALGREKEHFNLSPRIPSTFK